MGIFKQLFMIVHVFKVESHVRRVDDETKKNCAVDIRNVYSSVIVDKIYLLKAAGYCGDSCSEIVNGIL